MRILIADDHPLVLAGTREILRREEGFEVVGEARTGPDALALVGTVQPDVLLLDKRMPGLDGLTCIEHVRARHPEVKIVVLSATDDPELAQAAFRHGACGYILKSIDCRDLASAVRQAVDGTAYHALGLPALNEQTVARAVGLTERELEILKAVARGLSNRAISQELWVSEQTVKFHLTSAYRKLGVANRTEATRWVFSRGLVREGTHEPAS